MIYSIFKFIFGITLQSFFRRIGIKGSENIPSDGPVIFVANHPSAFMDPIVVGAFAKRTLHFIAAGEFFGKGLKHWFYRTQFNMIPVYRPSTMPGDTHKNKEMFEKCYQHLNKGGCLLIFPEGNSITEKRLRELKTGVARMAYGAEQQNDFKLGLNIVPMGLNYSDPHQFRSDLFVHIGKPIKVANYDHEPEDERELIRAITADVTDALQSAVLHIQDEKLDNVVAKVEHIFKPELKNIFGITSQLDKTFEMQKEVIDAIEHFDGIKEPAVTEIETEIDTYLSSLKKHGLTNRGLLESQTSITAFSLLKLILGLPFFVLGWLVNAIPYYLTRTIVLSLKVDEAFKGSLLMAVGTGAFVFYYIGMGIWASLHFNMWWLGIVGVLLAYALGLFCFIYSGWYGNFKEQLAFKNLIEEDRDEFAQLLLSRKEIVARLEQFRTSYTAE